MERNFSFKESIRTSFVFLRNFYLKIINLRSLVPYIKIIKNQLINSIVAILLILIFSPNLSYAYTYTYYEGFYVYACGDNSTFKLYTYGLSSVILYSIGLSRGAVIRLNGEEIYRGIRPCGDGGDFSRPMIDVTEYIQHGTNFVTYETTCGGCPTGWVVFQITKVCEDEDGDGALTCLGDCDDNDTSVYPGAPEICDGKDNNCLGQVDEGCAVCVDNDGDGYNAYDPTSCPEGNDCSDNDSAINPGAKEVCDGKDNNCDGKSDETCEGCSPNSTDMGSSANLASGNLYHSQEILTTSGSGLTANITITYNSLDTIIGPLGRGWTHKYSTSIAENEYGLVYMEDDGRRVYFYDNGDGTYSPEPSSGSNSTITKNPDGSYTLTEKSDIEYDYNSNGKLIRIIDRNNNTLTPTYTGDDLSLITDSSGRVTTLSYDSDHKITSITDYTGRITTFTYSGYFLSTVTDPSGGTWTYTYDADGRMLTKTDPSGYTTTYTYDTDGKIISSIDPEGKTKTISYDQTNQIAYVTEWDGGQWIYKYDNSLNIPLEVTDPLGNKTTYQYDSNRNLISKTEPDGSTTTYTYDADGNMTSQTDALGNTTSYTYDNYGQITSVTDLLGSTTAYFYDTNGNLISITDPSGAVTQMTYDSKGNITSVTNPNRQTTTYTYDQYNNLISITDANGATTTFTYDVSGNMTSQTDPEGNTTRFEYNSLNQLIKITDSLGSVTTYTYDRNGNRTSETDANGNTTYYEYNYKGQLIKVKDALGNVTTYAYGSGCPTCGGGGDKLINITDANGNMTTYQYDRLGRLTKETDPRGNTITYFYDSKGNLISKKDANGNTITYTYDSLNRLTKKKYPDSTEETFSYDAKENILTATNQNITYNFTYDANGRILTVTGSNGRTISYQYDSMGNKTQMTTPEGKTIMYTYDTGNRISQINSDAGSFNFTYDSLGRRTKLTYPNGVTTSYSYDNSGRITNLSTQNSQLQTLNSFAYTHDKVGNRLTKTEPDIKHTYSYDSIYRLTQSLPTKLKGKDKEQENKAEAFSYDAVGNRLIGPKAKDYYSYNQGNQLTNNRKHQYEYDKNGNLIRKIEKDDDDTSIWTYFYDYENRLVKVVKQEEDETTAVTFKYDSFGRRIEKRVDEIEDGEIEETKAYTYVYDNEDIILEYVTKMDDEDGEEKDEHHGKHKGREGGQKVIRFTHGPGIDEPLAVEKREHIYYYHADGLGSIVALTDAKQKVVENYEYDSFGNVKQHGNKVKQPYSYTSREYDSETGLYYYRARYYDAEIGRFISFDPILHPANEQSIYSPCGQVQNVFIPSVDSLKENPKNLHPYVYIANNPVNFVDPLGLKETKYTDCDEWLCLSCFVPLPWPKCCVRTCICYDEECGEKTNFRVCTQFMIGYPLDQPPVI